MTNAQCILFVLLLTASAYSEVQAQTYPIDRGSILVGGTASLTSQGGDLYKRGGNRLNTILINPGISYFIAPGFAFGAEVLLNRVSRGGDSVSSYGLGTSMSYFLGEPESRSYPFFSSSVFLLSVSEEFGVGLDISGGMALMLAKNVAITGEVVYLIERYALDADNGIGGNTLGIQVGIAAFIF